MSKVKCPKCGAIDKFYYDGTYIECRECKYREWAKIEKDGQITHLYDKWAGWPQEAGGKR